MEVGGGGGGGGGEGILQTRFIQNKAFYLASKGHLVKEERGYFFPSTKAMGLCKFVFYGSLLGPDLKVCICCFLTTNFLIR